MTFAAFPWRALLAVALTSAFASLTLGARATFAALGTVTPWRTTLTATFATTFARRALVTATTAITAITTAAITASVTTTAVATALIPVGTVTTTVATSFAGRLSGRRFFVRSGRRFIVLEPAENAIEEAFLALRRCRGVSCCGDWHRCGGYGCRGGSRRGFVGNVLNRRLKPGHFGSFLRCDIGLVFGRRFDHFVGGRKDTFGVQIVMA